MVPKEDESYDRPLINTEKLEEVISIYKFPLVLSLVGIVFLTLALSLLIKNKTNDDVVFTTNASPSAAAKIRIDIGGAVMTPGVYEFTEGKRIADALTSAGGLSAEADREWVAKNLNRAAKLVDGGKIYVPKVGESTLGKSQIPNPKSQDDQTNLLGVTTNLVNINTASQAELEALAGVGPVTAGKIIAGRQYQSIEELKTRKIVGNAVFEKIKNLLTVY
ncbi:ComEA family DNA-binding protein [Candidatus Gottesmanbacteria bacterium]|nr:ComEA family DNA-binding protein [Candidatus Gottesmanbacteria bacterium]